VLKKNNKEKARADSQLRRVHVDAPVAPSKPKNNNLFALLEEDSDNEDEQLNTLDDQDTFIGNPPYDNDNDTHTAKTWAQIAAKTTNTITQLPDGVYSANDIIADDEW
jgi:hypothetical protein